MKAKVINASPLLSGGRIVTAVDQVEEGTEACGSPINNLHQVHSCSSTSPISVGTMSILEVQRGLKNFIL